MHAFQLPETMTDFIISVPGNINTILIFNYTSLAPYIKLICVHKKKIGTCFYVIHTICVLIGIILKIKNVYIPTARAIL